MEHINHINIDENGDYFAFPENFLWGAATSPTQVEGETVNEWARVTANDGNGADDGSLHWRRYRHDFRLMASLNLRAYRLGFDWGRLQSAPYGALDREVRFRYLEMLAELRGLGITPFLTLFHHACPQWFADMGGWLNPESPKFYADFVKKLVILSDGEVQNWITVNEPNYYAFLAYIKGIFPPWRKMRISAYRTAVKNLQEAHWRAYQIIHEICPTAQVGLTTVLKSVTPNRSWHPLDQLSAKCTTRVFSHSSLAKFLSHYGQKSADFLGINYSGILSLNWQTLSPLAENSSSDSEYANNGDNSWEQNPEALHCGLRALAREFPIPLYITGHSIATENENTRISLLKDHLRVCQAAIAEGVDLRGYFYWSLVDNFDWRNGFRNGNGLLAVDFGDPDRRRAIRRTGYVYGEIARRNGFYAQ